MANESKKKNSWCDMFTNYTKDPMKIVLLFAVIAIVAYCFFGDKLSTLTTSSIGQDSMVNKFIAQNGGSFNY